MVIISICAQVKFVLFILQMESATQDSRHQEREARLPTTEINVEKFGLWNETWTLFFQFTVKPVI